MDEPPPVSDRRMFGIMGLVIAVVVAGVLAAIGGAALVRRDRHAPPPAAVADSSTQAVVRNATDLRSAPAANTAIVTRLVAGTPVRVVGRSPDGAWLVVGLTGNAEVIGWVPVAAVDGLADPQSLAVVADARAAAARLTPSVTFTPDLPDLRVERVFSRQNRLIVSVANDGPGDLTTPVLVAVNDGDPLRIETKSGEPLRARDHLEAAVPSTYVQLRAPVTVRVSTQPADAEEDTTNNTWSGIVEPDAPNDLEILSATSAGSDRHLVVTLRNNSPIPIAGSVTITVREAPPSTRLLGRDTRDITLDPTATVAVPFPSVRGVDVTQITVRLSTDAISDAVLANDAFPR